MQCCIPERSGDWYLCLWRNIWESDFCWMFPKVNGIRHWW